MNIGGTEWLWIALVVAILLFGSKKLPEVARSLGKAMGEFQKGKMEFEKEMRLATQQATAQTPLQPKEEVKEATKKEELQKAAAALGIDASTKSEEELKKAIKEKIA